jgi:hypothetical protein
MKYLTFLRLSSCLALAVLLVGCGGGNFVAVTGTVTLDGKPLEGAGIMFQPDAGGIPATGTSDAEGRFTLTTGNERGATIGIHSVAVSKPIDNPAHANVEEGVIVDIKLATPIKYASPRTSGLSVDVQHRMAPVLLELTSGRN